MSNDFKFPNINKDYVKFIVDENNNIVIAIISKHNAKVYMDRVIAKYWIYQQTKKNIIFMHPPLIGAVKAKAVCTYPDIFDVEKGKKIALIKLQNKLLSKIRHLANKQCEELENEYCLYSYLDYSIAEKIIQNNSKVDE